MKASAGLMAVVVLCVAGLTVGGYFLGQARGATTVTLNAMLAGIKDGVFAERDVSTFLWYRVCPELLGAIGRPPKLLMVYPARFQLKCDLGQAKVEATGENSFRVVLPAITYQVTDDYVHGMEYMARGAILQDSDKYVEQEKERAGNIVRWLAHNYARSNLAAVRSAMEDQIERLGFVTARREGAVAPMLEIVWDEAAQNERFEALESSLAQPPWGARGCEPGWFNCGEPTLTSLVQHAAWAAADPNLAAPAGAAAPGPHAFVVGAPNAIPTAAAEAEAEVTIVARPK